MSRRDTIIIAVLINAGLLVVLFSTALKSDSKQEEIAAVTPIEQQQAPVTTALEIPAAAQDPTIAAAAPQRDEVDQVLRQFSQTSTLVEGQTPATTNDFAQDLNGLTFSAPAVQPAIETPAPVMAAASEHTVKKGDVLEKIARVNHTTVEDIMRVNHMSSTRLKIGQVLKIPTGSKSSNAKGETASSGAKYYTVKNGDNPWTIAVKNHLKVEELLKLNNLDQDKARRLKPGDKLRIR